MSVLLTRLVYKNNLEESKMSDRDRIEKEMKKKWKRNENELKKK